MKKKFLGIWMDHSNAHLMELCTDILETKIIKSKFIQFVKEAVLYKGEKEMLYKIYDEQLPFYKELGAAIMNYEEVLLFGATDAKTALLNLLKTDRHIDNINIETRQTENMTENQDQAFVKEYFLNYLSPGK